MSEFLVRRFFFSSVSLSCTEMFHDLTSKESAMSNASLQDPLMPCGRFDVMKTDFINEKT